MDALNMPLEMIAVCSPDGELSPARFRLETESGERVTVRIRQIRRREEIRLMGVESIRFVWRCWADSCGALSCATACARTAGRSGSFSTEMFPRADR